MGNHISDAALAAAIHRGITQLKMRLQDHDTLPSSAPSSNTPSTKLLQLRSQVSQMTRRGMLNLRQKANIKTLLSSQDSVRMGQGLSLLEEHMTTWSSSQDR